MRLTFPQKTYVRKDGPIIRDTATEEFLPVIPGVAARQHAPLLGLIFPAYTVRKKMYTYRVSMVATTLGSAFLTGTLKVHSCGVMDHSLISITGRAINQTIFMKRIASILLVSLQIISINGTMSIAQTVINSLARKVGHPDDGKIVFTRSKVLWEKEEHVYFPGFYNARVSIPFPIRGFRWCNRRLFPEKGPYDLFSPLG